MSVGVDGRLAGETEQVAETLEAQGQLVDVANVGVDGTQQLIVADPLAHCPHHRVGRPADPCQVVTTDEHIVERHQLEVPIGRHRLHGGVGTLDGAHVAGQPSDRVGFGTGTDSRAVLGCGNQQHLLQVTEGFGHLAVGVGQDHPHVGRGGPDCLRLPPAPAGFQFVNHRRSHQERRRTAALPGRIT